MRPAGPTLVTGVPAEGWHWPALGHRSASRRLAPACTRAPEWYIRATKVEEAAARAAAAARTQQTAAEPKARPAVYRYFDLVKTGVHVQGTDGKQVPCEWYQCKKAAHKTCKIKGSPPIKVVQKATGGLLKHVRVCEGEET